FIILQCLGGSFENSSKAIEGLFDKWVIVPGDGPFRFKILQRSHFFCIWKLDFDFATFCGYKYDLFVRNLKSLEPQVLESDTLVELL
ncbi:hypothetical protein TorRG33x02_072420, partial [Trema orientale]